MTPRQVFDRTAPAASASTEPAQRLGEHLFVVVDQQNGHTSADGRQKQEHDQRQPPHVQRVHDLGKGRRGVRLGTAEISWLARITEQTREQDTETIHDESNRRVQQKFFHVQEKEKLGISFRLKSESRLVPHDLVDQ